MPAQIIVRYWAGAQRAAGRAEEQLTADTLAEVRGQLSARAGFERLAQVASFLVDGQQTAESGRLAEGAVVDVLPPFAGGER